MCPSNFVREKKKEQKNVNGGFCVHAIFGRLPAIMCGITRVVRTEKEDSHIEGTDCTEFIRG